MVASPPARINSVAAAIRVAERAFAHGDCDHVEICASAGLAPDPGKAD